MGNGMYEKSTPVSSYVCNRLYLVGEDGVRTRRVARFCKLFRRYQESARKFIEFTVHSCTKDGEFKVRSFVVHMNVEFPIWFTETI